MNSNKPQYYNPDAEKYVDKSEFIEDLLQFPADSAERISYIDNHTNEKDDILARLVYILRPVDDPNWKKKYLKNRPSEVHQAMIESIDINSMALLNSYERALQKWDGTILFRIYVINIYKKEARYEEDREYNYGVFGSAETRTVLQLAKKVNKIMNSTFTRVSFEEAREQLELEGEIHQNAVWKRAELKLADQLLFIDADNEDEDGNLIENDISKTMVFNYEPDSDEIKMEKEKDALAGFLVGCYDRLMNKSLKQRKWVQYGFTGRILKYMKYEDGKPIAREPAGRREFYNLLVECAPSYLKDLLEYGFIRYLIEDKPLPLDELKGIYNNLFRDGRKAEHKYLASYMAENSMKGCTEANVSQHLTNIDWAFSDSAMKEVRKNAGVSKAK